MVRKFVFEVAKFILGHWYGLYLTEKDREDGSRIVADYLLANEEKRFDMFAQLIADKQGIRRAKRILSYDLDGFSPETRERLKKYLNTQPISPPDMIGQPI